MISNLDHIVIVVKDLFETELFYSSFLGSPLETAEGSIAYEIGKTKLMFVLPEHKFAQYNKNEGGMNHIAFAVENEDELRDVLGRLGVANIKNSGIEIDKVEGKKYVWFDDPSGVSLEFYLNK